MTVINESRHAGEFMVSEANGHRSREVVTIASGAALEAGTVLGKVTASGNYKLHDAAAADGSENAVAVLYARADASGGDVQATAIVRDAEVADGALTFKSGISGADRTAAIADLATVGIIAR
jgi:hypothetical protein